NVAIPGGIDGHRRDIDMVLRIIEKLNNKNIEFNFIGNILGIPGEKTLQKINLLKQSGYNLNHYYDETDNRLFEKKMSESDIILSPLNVFTNYEGIKEVYGLTKSTGVVFDMMRFEKPGIVPVELNTNKNIESSILKYKNEDDLINIIINLYNNPAYLQKLTDNAINNAKHFKKENLVERILQELEIYNLQPTKC
ncbi:MAG: hypothetical protein ACK4ON_06820, partial [Bacteroidia bacterium]